LNESYMEWENATTKCQSLGARLPVLDTKETIDIVKSYLSKADPEELRALEEWDQSSRRVWLGLNFNPGSGLTWADGQRVIAYPASSRLFVWESRRLLSVEVSYADNSRHYGFYIDGDIAKLPGGGRRGAAVLCELLPDELRRIQTLTLQLWGHQWGLRQEATPIGLCTPAEVDTPAQEGASLETTASQPGLLIQGRMMEATQATKALTSTSSFYLSPPQ